MVRTYIGLLFDRAPIGRLWEQSLHGKGNKSLAVKHSVTRPNKHLRRLKTTDSLIIVTVCVYNHVCVRVSQSNVSLTTFNTSSSSSLRVNGTSVMRLRSLSTDMAVVGRHVTGDVIAEVEVERDVRLQLQWTTRVDGGDNRPPYDVPIVGKYQRQKSIYLSRCITGRFLHRNQCLTETVYGKMAPAWGKPRLWNSHGPITSRLSRGCVWSW